MSGDLFPDPRLLLVGVIYQVLRQQTIEIGGTIIVPAWEMAVLLAEGFHPDVVHDDLLAGINADLVLPAGSDGYLVDHNLLLLRRAGIWLVRATHALDAEYLLADTLPALHTDILGEVTAFIHEGHADLQAQTVLETVGVIDYII